MPMENVHFIGSHCFQVNFDDIGIQVMARGVQEKATMIEPRVVMDIGIVDQVLDKQVQAVHCD